jgi:CRP/FNR family cyclic AMP-dependent transcriptional regulator
MDLAAKVRLLRQIPYFGALPAPELRALAIGLRERRYRAGDVIFRRGDQSEGLCIVLSGRVRTVIRSAEGREQVLKVFGPGRTFADIAVFDDEPQPAEAVAVSESTVVIIAEADLLDLLRRHPEVAIEVIRLFASRLRAYKQMVEDLSLRTVVARVARLLVDRAGGKQTLIEESASSSPEYTQDEIAAMVGSVREVVQRALKTLEHAGLIQMARGRVQVIDVEALDGWTESESNVVGPLSRNPSPANTSHEKVETGWQPAHRGLHHLTGN